jgi:Tfp pilus tip-associated adhesin PilY1
LIARGNGDGTFRKPVSYPVKNGVYGFSFAAGDFNSDGKTDLIVSYVTFNASVFELFLGNGDGTFRKAKPVNLHGVYNAELGLVPADLNSDGLLDFIFQQPGDVSVFTQK